MLACCRIEFLVRAAVSWATSTSRIRLLAAVMFSNCTARFRIVEPRRFCTAPRLPRSDETVLIAGTHDASAMARGQAGLPTGFTWRERHYAIIETLSEWKASEAENHAAGERYYRKHFWRVRVETGETMTLYALRQVKAGENPKRRWWLYTIES